MHIREALSSLRVENSTVRSSCVIESLESRRMLSAAPHHAADPIAQITQTPVSVSKSAKHSSSALEAAYLRAIEAVKAEFKIPGVLVGITDRKGKTFHAAVGLADVDTGEPISVDQHFSIRSITKSFTVTLILQLARAKMLSLDDPISKYYPGVPNGNDITLAQLAAMESGVKSYTLVDKFLDEFVANFSKPWTPQEIIDLALKESPIFDPGAEYNYSNTNTLLLGVVAEKVAKMPLAQAYQKFIFDPLGLSETSYPESTAFPSPHPVPYLVNPQTGELGTVTPPLNNSALGAAGAIVSTIDDLLTWGRALGTGELIGSKLQKLRERESRRADDGPEYDLYGLGIGELKGWWGHSGEALGYQAATFYEPISRTTIAVLVNSSQPVHVAVEVFKALADVIRPKGIPGKSHHFSDKVLTDPDSDGLLE